MSFQELHFRIYVGIEIIPHIHEVSKFRVQYFKDYPYLYCGNIDYEKQYLQSFSVEPEAILVAAFDSENKLSAISTGLPLLCSSSILADGPEMFLKNGLDPKKIFYYGEIIISYKYRLKGVVRKVYAMQEKFAITKGFTSIALSTVVRDDFDFRKPQGYKDTDGLWRALGFTRTNMHFEFEWPTYDVNGNVTDQSNQMVYWTKSTEESSV
ncbi:MAG: hypothetical protein H7333_11420 [Bdellovibrionales bacterium]|nr:hypothetical protein [Oligoflexia bacterium]